MSNETENMKTDTPANDTERSASGPDAPRTPEEVMQAATARIAATGGGTGGDEGPLDALRSGESRMSAPAPHREVDETRQYAVQKFAQDVVEAAENLRRGLDSLPPAATESRRSLRGCAKASKGSSAASSNILERNGIKRDDPTGAPFDPNLHQAMAEQESAAHPPGSVMHAWTPVWTLNGRLLRPAMVVVAKAPPAEIASAFGGPAGAAKLDTTA